MTLYQAKSRFSMRIGTLGSRLTFTLAIITLAASVYSAIALPRFDLVLFGLAALFASLTIWLRRDIGHLQPTPFTRTAVIADILPPALAASYNNRLTQAALWNVLIKQWEGLFILSRYGLQPVEIVAHLDETVITPEFWDRAKHCAETAGLEKLTIGSIMVALLQYVASLGPVLKTAKLEPSDLMEGLTWIARVEAFRSHKRPSYGGLARDWAAGFTPTLNQFGQNLSRQVELAGTQFGLQERTTQLDGLISGLSSATGSVIVVGEPGIGKSALLYGLADRLLRGENSGALAHNQVIALNASVILSSQQRAGDIERIMLQILGEAAHAGNIVVALDEAQLFFGQGTGAVNLSQLLLPVLQARSLKMVLAVTPGDWQRLKSTNVAMAGLLTPLILVEPTQAQVIEVLADRALLLEAKGQITTYQALQEAYRLSGRYYPDEAYPGRALKLLEAAMNQPDGAYISAVSVQRAVESQTGVKVERAGTDEVDVLLHLEDHIHRRMINQTRAVSVVAAALRRARAGVANPKRPIGSFLFLGPTGVGKTELAKSLAALYFGSEANMIRLDMSEYQQPADVARLLASAAENPAGLLAKVRSTPFAVVLFDEIEKAHPNLLNLLLQLLDEGNLTDSSSKATSFKDAIIIATSNAGADEIRRHIEAGEALESFEQAFTDNLISSGSFKPELLNRFDEIVLFRPLNEAELAQVVGLLVAEINRTLEPQKVTVTLTPPATAQLVKEGYDPRLGARPMRRMVQRRVEDAVAGKILRGEATAGAIIALDVADVTAIPVV